MELCKNVEDLPKHVPSNEVFTEEGSSFRCNKCQFYSESKGGVNLHFSKMHKNPKKKRT